MSKPPSNLAAPKSEKGNQHYIPRWWLKGFADDKGSVWALRDGRVAVVGVGNIMNAAWIYTVFDGWWRPSDAVEDSLAVVENFGSKVFAQLHTSPPNDEMWQDLFWFLALTVCRHPDVMRRGHELSKEFGMALRDAPSFDEKATFNAALEGTFGPIPTDDAYEVLAAAPQEALDSAVETLIDLQPYDPSLPEVEAILAADQVAAVIGTMNCRLLVAPAGSMFVLSDRPLPAKDLAQGFEVPLSKRMALEARPAYGAGAARSCEAASAQEVEAINLAQARRRKDILIGPDPTTLERYNS
jgi:hypothetical protein